MVSDAVDARLNPRKPAVFLGIGITAFVALLFIPSREFDSDAISGSSAAPSTPTVVMTTTATTTVPDAPTTTSPPRPGSITLAFAGDLLPHTPVDRAAATYGARSGAAYDFAPMFESMRPVLEPVDRAICHMEVPLHPDGEAPSSYPTFGSPPELVAGARSAGYDGCSTASNHSLDRGRRGIDRLLDTLDANGMEHNGTARSEAEGGGRATVYDIGGMKVAHLSFAYDFNGYQVPADAPWSVNRIEPEMITARAAEARRNGADLVVVSLHWGTEYQHEPSAQQQQWAEVLTSSPDIDLLIGHHAHVVQPISKVNDTFVVWGLGNQLSGQTQLPRRDGLTVVVHAEPDAANRWRVSTIEAVPTFVDLPSYRILPVVQTLATHGAPPALDAQLRASYARTAAVIAQRPTPGVTLAPLP